MFSAGECAPETSKTKSFIVLDGVLEELGSRPKAASNVSQRTSDLAAQKKGVAAAAVSIYRANASRARPPTHRDARRPQQQRPAPTTTMATQIWTAAGKKGTLVRQECAKTSPQVAELERGTVLQVEEEALADDGTPRLRISSPVPRRRRNRRRPVGGWRAAPPPWRHRGARGRSVSVVSTDPARTRRDGRRSSPRTHGKPAIEVRGAAAAAAWIYQRRRVAAAARPRRGLSETTRAEATRLLASDQFRLAGLLDAGVGARLRGVGLASSSSRRTSENDRRPRRSRAGSRRSSRDA